MTQVILKPDEFIITVTNEDMAAVLLGKEDLKFQLINPHKGKYGQVKLEMIKALLVCIKYMEKNDLGATETHS